MGNYVDRKLRSVADSCTTRETYRFDGQAYTVAIDWPAIADKINAINGENRQLIGGLLPSRWSSNFAPSFANYQKTENLIVINPVGWRMKVIFSTGLHNNPWRNLPIDERVGGLIAMLIAHESRHIKQGIKDYGFLKTILIMPGTVFGLYAVAIAVLLAILSLTSWNVMLAILIYTLLANLAYWYDWREVDARRYAQEHWRDWLSYITVTPK